MRIGFISGEYPPMEGGVGAFTKILAETMAAQGHKVFVFSGNASRSDNPAIQLTNPVEKWQMNSLRTIAAWAVEKKLDIVNLQFQTAAYGMSPWIHFLPQLIGRIPLVTTFHDLRFPYLFPKAGPLRNWIVNHLARTSSSVIATNHEDFARLKHLPHAKLIPIGSNILAPLPVDFEPAAWRAKIGATADDFVIAYFGLINRSKGLETLLHSLADLRAQHIPARLLIIGGSSGSSDPTNAAYKTEIDSLIKSLNLTSVVHETGFISDEAVGAFLSASDTVALPFLDGASYRRGSLMAAIHYGCAIVTTQPAVEISAFVDGDTMRLVRPNDRRVLTPVLQELYQTPGSRQLLREGAAKLAKQFEWDAIARETASFFQQVVNA